MRNKKKTALRGLYGVLGAFILLGLIKYLRLPEFHVMNSYSMSYTIKEWSWGLYTYFNLFLKNNINDPELYKRIEYEHNRINGEPTELKLRLFKSKNDIIKGREPYKVIIIDYINDTVEIK